MPSKALPEVDHFTPVSPSKEKIDFVDLLSIDLSLYDHGPRARARLAETVRQAMTTQGFFVITNHGIPGAELERQVDIGHTILSRTPAAEKAELKARITEDGSYPGFKPRGHWRTQGNQRDRIEAFNVYRKLEQNKQPAALEPYRGEIQDFVDHLHKDILYKVLRLFAIALGIEDEDLFVRMHDYERHDESWLRWMEYYDDQDDKAEKALWLGGHRDLTNLSFLFSQPMTSLQVRDVNDGAEWKYVAHVPEGMIVNAGEIMQWLTGDYFKAAIHRVVEPPADQQGHDRSSVFYFVVPNDDVVLNTVLEHSPVLREAGIERAFKDGEAPTSKEWVNARIKMTGQSKVYKEGEKVVEEKVGRVTTKWFN